MKTQPHSHRPWPARLTRLVRVAPAQALALLVGITILVGASPVHGTALDLDGVDDHLTVPAGVWFGNEFTIETWVYVRSYNYYSRVIDFGNGASSDNIVLALSRETTGRPEFNIFPSGQALLAPDPIPLNEWVHLAVTVKTNTATMYINGVAVVSGTVGTPNPVIRNNNYIGRSNWPGDAYANALIDELRIWDVARTPSELQATLKARLTGEEPGLVAYYPMDEGAGSVTADASGNGNTGTLVAGAGWNTLEDAVAPRALTVQATMVTNTTVQLNGLVNPNGVTTSNRFEWGGASTGLEFDGVDDHVTVPAGVWFGNEFTIETWVYARGYNYYSRVIDFGNGAPSDNIVLALSRETTGRPEFNIFPSGQALLAPDPIPLNEWVHLAVTVKTNTAIMYVNGVAVVSGPAGTPNPVVRNNNYIGRSNWPGDAYADALIDELRIWNVARTPSEILATLKASLTGDEPGLLAYYPMDEGFGRRTADVSGNGNTGALKNTPTWSSGARPVIDEVTAWQPVDGPNSLLNLDGVDDHVTVPAGVWFWEEFTIETWVYARGYNYYSRVIDFGNGDPSDNIVLALSRETTGRPEFSIFPSGQPLLAPNPIPLNEWVHLAVTVKTNTAIMYVNGVAVKSGPVGTPNPVIRNNNYIGRSNWPGDAYASALMDDLRLWNVARSPDQIRQFSTQPVSPSDPNLLLNYRFDQPSGLIAVDSRSTSPQNGTLTNGADRLASIPVSAPLVGLVPGTIYHYRSVVQNTNGRAAGQTERFVTLAPVRGTALQFDGVNDHAVLGTGINLASKSFTCEAWVRRAGAATGNKWLFNQGVEANNQNLHIGFIDNKATFRFFANDYTTDTTFPDSAWHHWAFTYNSTNRARQIFRDGVLVGEDTAAADFVGTGPMYLGQRFGDGHFDGQMDEVRIWDVARTPAEIRATLDMRLEGAQPGLVAYYRMDEGAGVVTADATVNANRGLLVNGPLWVPSSRPACGVATNFTIGDTAYFQGYQPVARWLATPSVTNMVVSNLCENITGGGAAGVELSDGNAGLNLSLHYDGGIQTNLTSGDNAAGLRVASYGALPTGQGQPGGTAGTSTIVSTGTITTLGDDSSGIEAISQGGAGGGGNPATAMATPVEWVGMVEQWPLTAPA